MEERRATLASNTSSGDSKIGNFNDKVDYENIYPFMIEYLKLYLAYKNKLFLETIRSSLCSIKINIKSFSHLCLLLLTTLPLSTEKRTGVAPSLTNHD